MQEFWQVPKPIAVLEVSAPDGASTFVRRHGNPEGPRMVISHGNGLSADAYYPFWSRFADRFELFVYDLRSHGWNRGGDRLMHNVHVFAEDSERIVCEIDRQFGNKPAVGVFHSLSTLVALRHAVLNGARFSALVLFDPPVCPPGGRPEDLEGFGGILAEITRKRCEKFENPEELAMQFRKNFAFERVPPAALELMARTTLRPADSGIGYELRCPRDFEAQIYEFAFLWSMIVDFTSIGCPIKAIGSDPTLPYSFMPSLDIGDILRLDYDFVPETSHLLQIERPEQCAALTLEFLGDVGLA